MENKPIRVGLLGFGKTGKAVASVLLQSSEFHLEWGLRQGTLLEHHSISEFLGIESAVPGCIYSSQHISASELIAEHPVDVIIDFSSTSGIHYYADVAKEHGIKIVTAISHYEEKEIALINELSKHTAILWSPNITIGVNYMILAAQVMRKIAPGIDIEIVEEHFKLKPELSGTAIKIAQSLGKERSDIKSIRAGGIVGKHEVIFGFPFQVVRLIHESISREAFGNGAIFACKHLMEKPPGRYTMDELMVPYFNVEFTGLHEKGSA
ncbi:MAG: dihydrodipicolinate reductase C-terminal domain-containing protein [Burkholderiaceae bacterium]|nr:dihydrodipicolinate reductase C-terminal domain-containing protein [Burkholderiaceae bacterium]